MPKQGHDILAIGTSAGGLDALSTVVAGLPPDLPAAVFIVMHTSPTTRSTLPELLATRGPLPVTHALHGERFECGRIYVAPPDNHLIVRPGFLQVVRGPKENGHRPSVDVLFRSAAASYGPRTIGVVLTGYLDCGTAGLLSIKARGGIGVAEDPLTAAVPEMPRSAIVNVEVDHVVSLGNMPALLSKLVRAPADIEPRALPPGLLALEGKELGRRIGVVCPVCQGSLSESQAEGVVGFRCHVGHAFSLETLVNDQAEEAERALWAATRALEESAAMSARIAARSTGELKRRFAEKARMQNRQADVLRGIILDPRRLVATDAPDVGKQRRAQAAARRGDGNARTEPVLARPRSSSPSGARVARGRSRPPRRAR